MSEPKNDDDVASSKLASIILAQSSDVIGVPVVLFNDTTLATAVSPASSPGDAAPREIDSLVTELGFDRESLALFGTEAYVLQTALGARLLPENR